MLRDYKQLQKSARQVKYYIFKYYEFMTSETPENNIIKTYQ